MDNVPKSVHFVGVGGVAMGTLAVALSKSGYTVSGSDGIIYEPMKSVLQKATVSLIEGYQASTIAAVEADLVIIGNVMRRDNPEVMAWLRAGKKFISFPEAVRRFLLGDKLSIVCAGTHGKTTTSSWISFLLSQLGEGLSYLIGGVPVDLPGGCELREGKLFVCEGDEYDSAFFDKGSKFLHYNPHFAIISSIEFDHADIYRDLDHVKASFEKLVSLLPGDGLCVVRQDDRNAMSVASLSLCPVQTFGIGSSAMWKLGKVEENEEGFHFEIFYKNRNAGKFQTRLFGEHNLMNLISGIAVAVNLGYRLEKIRPLVPLFRGVLRRQQILLEKPNLFIDDFAHHPTEVAATLGAVRRRYPQRKIWALFEPRSATARRNVHQEAYVKAFDSANEILVSSAYRADEVKDSNRFSVETLVENLKALGKLAMCFQEAGQIVPALLGRIQPEDIVVVMSNGEFGKIQEKILKALAG